MVKKKNVLSGRFRYLNLHTCSSQTEIFTMVSDSSPALVFYPAWQNRSCIIKSFITLPKNEEKLFPL